MHAAHHGGIPDDDGGRGNGPTVPDGRRRENANGHAARTTETLAAAERNEGHKGVRIPFATSRSGNAVGKRGVSEQHIKLHGNWKSNAVQAYIRPGMEERLHASDALGGR